jgi:hypothetical protein
VFRLPLHLPWSPVLHSGTGSISQYALIIVLLSMICYLSTIFWMNTTESLMVFKMVSVCISCSSPLVRPHQIILPFYCIMMPFIVFLNVSLLWVVTLVLSLIWTWKLLLVHFKCLLCPSFPKWGDQTNTELFEIFHSRFKYLPIPHNCLSTRWLTPMISLAHGAPLRQFVQSFKTYPQVLKPPHGTLLKHIIPFLSCRHSGLLLWCALMMTPFMSTLVPPLAWAHL